MGSKERKAKKKIKKYYKEKMATVQERAAIDTKRLEEDIAKIMEESGIQQTRATEDYIRNIGNIEEQRDADLDDLNYYIQTSTSRTQEDLQTSLAKEARRFDLEWEKINESLANAGLTFSNRRPEQIATEGHEMNVTDIQTEANRSFQDIARYEATLNRDIEMKYGQLTEEAQVTKTRSIEDILRQQEADTLSKQRGIEDIAFGKAVDIRDLKYQRDTDLATTEQLFDIEDAYEDLYEELYD